MSIANVYNQLPSIQEASRNLNRQLGDAGITINQLLEELRPSFSDDSGRAQFAIWLLHRHLTLKDEERLVRRGNISQAEATTNDPNIIIERWGRNAEGLEYAYNDLGESDIPSRPPANVLNAFQMATTRDGRNIDCLAICLSPTAEELRRLEGRFFTVERIDSEKHVVTVEHENDLSPKATLYEATWAISGDWGYKCDHGTPS